MHGAESVLVCVEFNFREVVLWAFSNLVKIIKFAVFPTQFLDVVVVRPAVHDAALVNGKVFLFVPVACQLEPVRCIIIIQLTYLVEGHDNS